MFVAIGTVDGCTAVASTDVGAYILASPTYIPCFALVDIYAMECNVRIGENGTGKGCEKI